MWAFLPVTPGHQSTFENLFYEDGCPRVKASPLFQQNSPPSGLSRVNYRKSSAYSQEALFLGLLLPNSDLQTLQPLPHPESWFFPGRWHFHLDPGFKPLSLGRGCCAGSSRLCGLFSSHTEQGPPSSCVVGFSLWWFLLLWSTGSRVHQLQ